uniref:Cytochrome b n=1 Tax=Myzostoma seymourcollegiorum TaxID=447489 RepID=CYB_MYZSE|nr:RecName: Full=Cytochrome b; AltName: Full=Complex III subunit 3; AltName: Full=Complex III subunit III; AltName: Full=Cytochrome b-c1 complex subunit 3; AltName: Full=Ubiquinol-cytochrome-c reductase complex cytochrome b subunit [Myzostoma seymourcollegiorum]ABR12404.1 cytochrome b [Myzostoma seymourcollegiorum]
MNLKHPTRKDHILIKVVNNLLIDLPTPSNLSIMWNWGSLLGIFLIIPIITGLFLAMHYTPHMNLAFESIYHIMYDVNMGWLIRFIHVNGASFFFIFLYLHMARGMYYYSFHYKEVWLIGCTIYVVSMATAFMGYILPWGQMSLWGATVITNMLTTIPYLGQYLVQWIWGGFAVGNPTLNRFFVLHFILPFIILALSIIHLIFLHSKGSTNPLGMNSNAYKIPFHPYYSSKDLMFLLLLMMIMMVIIFWNPFLFMDAENSLEANFMKTPVHIKPEWYFLWVYTLLRSIPNKLGGVLTMVFSILILFLLPFISNFNYITSMSMINKLLFWSFVVNMLILTWIGGMPVVPLFETMGLTSTFLYFIIILIYSNSFLMINKS